jgi:hypothetical protein
MPSDLAAIICFDRSGEGSGVGMVEFLGDLVNGPDK